jgi:hypothetical protein
MRTGIDPSNGSSVPVVGWLVTDADGEVRRKDANA